MLDRILASSGVAMDKVLLRESLRVESVDSTSIYRVIAYHADAQTATKLANAAAEALRTDAEDFFNFNYVMSLGDADEDALGASDIVLRPTPTPVPTPEPTPDPTPIPTLDPEDPLLEPIPPALRAHQQKSYGGSGLRTGPAGGGRRYSGTGVDG